MPAEEVARGLIYTVSNQR